MTDRPRMWQFAAFLTLVAAGLGQVYNGEGRKGALLLVAFIPLVGLIGLLVLSPFFAFATPVAVVLGVGFLGYALADAIAGSRKRADAYELKPYNRVLVYVGIVVVAGLAREGLTLGLREGVVQAFRIPSESMLPTLQVGDYLFVDKRAGARVPRRGDVIVYRYPEDPRRSYIHRVVAVGGDKVEVRDKVVYVNDRAAEDAHVIHIDPATHSGEFDPRDNCGPYAVPKGSYFVMGDNRDNSNDSRFWGPLEGALVEGKARGIYWSWDGEKGGPRWDRIGSLIR